MTKFILLDGYSDWDNGEGVNKEISLEELEKVVVDERKFNESIDWGMSCLAVKEVDTVNEIVYLKRDGYKE
jgi:hypothetical protein